MARFLAGNTVQQNSNLQPQNSWCLPAATALCAALTLQRQTWLAPQQTATRTHAAALQVGLLSVMCMPRPVVG